MPVAVRLSDAMTFNGRELLRVHQQAAAITVPHAAYYPPVDTDVFRPPDHDRRVTGQTLGLADDDLVVGSVANVNPDKGLEYLVRAAPAVLAAEPRARFVVVGARYPNHAAYADGLQAELDQAGISDRFRFVGELDDVADAYAAMDVDVISSVREGTTTTAMEAMATGIPVVASDVGAVHEVVVDGETGTLVPARDPDALAKAILGCLATPRSARASAAPAATAPSPPSAPNAAPPSTSASSRPRWSTIAAAKERTGWTGEVVPV